MLGDPPDDLVGELEDTGTAVEVVRGVRNLADPASAPALVAAALARFGRIDSAVAFSGQIVTGRFVDGWLSRDRRNRWNRRATASRPTPYDP